MPIRARAINRARRAYAINTRLRYRNGRPHGAYDVGTPIGTPIYAPSDGVVVARRDGVANNRRWQRRWRGMPSNWILLKVYVKRRDGKMAPATIFWQHLSPGLKVKTGQHVSKGQLLGYTGNTGNSTGPHLHVGAQWVTRAHPATSGHRYDHVANAKLRIWPPERFLKP